jgi:beta-glucosidase
MMKLQKAFFIIFIMVVSATLLATLACVQEGEVYQKVDALLTKMMLEEKIGQMTQYSGFNEERAQWVREGKIGSFLNIHGAEQTNKIQKIAKEESRLGIPLIFG